jgi:adenylosuccinate lyase
MAMIDRYSTPEMRELWSERAKFEAWLEVELAACEAWAELGRIPADDLKTIREKAKFEVPRIEELDRELHHDVIAFTTNLAEHIGPSSRFVHMGLTSTDVVDTAQSLRLRTAGELIAVELAKLIATLRSFAEQHKQTVMIGRTHGVHAEPITLGLKFLVFHQEMLRNRSRLERALSDVCVGKISGAVGTHAHTGPDFEARVCKALSLSPAPVATQVLQRDRHAAFVAALAVCAGTIEKIAVEIRHLQRTEVRELEEPFAKGQKGSSAMPHKRNPVKCEQLTGLSRLVRGYALSAMENQALWHERDISHSSAERVILSDATTLVHYMLRQMNLIVSGLHVYPDAMQANLQRTRGLLFSQKILLELVQSGMSREDAYAVVQGAAMRTWADPNTRLRTELLSDPKFAGQISPDKLDVAMDYSSFLQYVDAIFARAEKE